MSFAAVFPGQGSQSIGMLGELAAAHPQVQQTFTEASQVLGYDLWALTQQGPEERLNSTQQTQPALLAAGVAAWRAWKAAGGRDPSAMAGHSLGEYTALVCAGAMDFSAAVKLVEFRGHAMQEAVPAGTGAMFVIIGLDDEAVRAACAEAAQGEVVEAVNFNAPGQVVIAGHAAAVMRASERAKALGAKRAIPLAVSAPFHCPLMKPAEERLAPELRALHSNDPAFPVVANVDAQPKRTASESIDALVRQVSSPVRWEDVVKRLIADGARTFVELGPGNVLAGLIKKIDRSVTVVSVEDAEGLEAALNL